MSAMYRRYSEENVSPAELREVVTTSWQPLPPEITPTEPLWLMTDIHGKFTEMQRLLKAVRDKSRHPAHLVFLGDVCDRGPQSVKALNFLLDLKEPGAGPDGSPRLPDLLWGNHDALAFAVLFPERMPYLNDEWGVENVWDNNGCESTLLSVVNAVPMGDLLELRRGARRLFEPYFARLKKYLICGNLLLCHAGLPPGKSLEFFDPVLPVTDEDSWLWYRPDCTPKDYASPRLDPEGQKLFTIFGHTPQDPAAAQAPYALALDFGYDLQALLEIVPAATLSETDRPADLTDADPARAYYRYYLTGSNAIMEPRHSPRKVAQVLEMHVCHIPG